MDSDSGSHRSERNGSFIGADLNNDSYVSVPQHELDRVTVTEKNITMKERLAVRVSN